MSVELLDLLSLNQLLVLSAAVTLSPHVSHMHVYMNVLEKRRLLVGTLHSRPVVAALVVRAVVVGLSASA